MYGKHFSHCVAVKVIALVVQGSSYSLTHVTSSMLSTY